MKKWEYKAINLGQIPDSNESNNLLNSFGENSWELISVASDGIYEDKSCGVQNADFYAFFKREKTK